MHRLVPIDKDVRPYPIRHPRGVVVSGSRPRLTAPRVVPQSAECLSKGVGAPCGCDPVTGVCVGTCNSQFECVPSHPASRVVDPFRGGDPYRVA